MVRRVRVRRARVLENGVLAGILEETDAGYRFTYDLICTSLHFPSESRLALSLLRDGDETAAYAAHGFETGACFLELGARLGVDEATARHVIGSFLAEGASTAVAELVGRSFLGPEAKADYLRRFQDRRGALRIGL